ncbi:hypothetical protein ACFPMF_15200 [Larkinella bovis]|uniref:DUF4468 domain-containing protein n=1 Tax=Larkinella bovis TaxID=683041 RepID=A0ABW0IBA1_9BACT
MAYTTVTSLPLKLSYLNRNGFLKKGNKITGKLVWKNQFGEVLAEAKIETYNSTNEKGYIKLTYDLRDGQSGIYMSFDQVIFLESRISNLGKGNVLYFICPTTATCCRVLYRVDENHIWQGKNAYDTQIYYPLQISSKSQYQNEKYWNMKDSLVEIIREKFTHYYKGIQTRRAKRFYKRLDKILKIEETMLKP